tara:strand:- start:369 stop:650 length:282 start_codon:yes stop_codon:yes gene_type:complete
MSGIREIKKLKFWLENSEADIGWYSQKQRRSRHGWSDNKFKHCACIYKTPEGNEVIVTEVSKSYTYDSEWDDVKMVGAVTRFVRPLYGLHTFL